ncbi:hypothetical protein V6N12_051801 [Hibiscus sabdariffa]|uniref:Uncharacterized protein n=1 Tax=Hibiscus sabdariffa TaxID=183260 RepID=A0ABR2GGE0_9ROSI
MKKLTRVVAEKSFFVYLYLQGWMIVDHQEAFVDNGALPVMVFYITYLLSFVDHGIQRRQYRFERRCLMQGQSPISNVGKARRSLSLA